MKILYLADIRFPMERANGIQTIETAHALAREGAEVALVVRRTDGRSDEACLAFFGLAPHPGLRLRRVATPFGRWSWLAASMGMVLRDRGPSTVIYTRDLLVADLALRLRRLHGLPVVYEAHAVASVFAAERASMYETESPPTRGKRERLDARERRVARRASGIVTITEALRQALAARHGEIAPSAVVPDGCRLPSSPPTEPASHPPPVRVVYIGQLYPWKGVDVLVEAMRELDDVELVIVGGLPPEPDLDRLERLASDRGLGSRVRFRGFVPPPELASERTSADLFAVPLLDSTTARLFTSPLKLFEAMASRRPLVASDLPSIREVLGDGVNALLVPPGDPVALATAIRRLADDPALSRRLAARAFEDVKAYSWDRRAERLVRFLSGLSGLTREGSAGSGSSDR
jgi:glycosyltransferase involved in cell wall biosynthesis